MAALRTPLVLMLACMLLAGAGLASQWGAGAIWQAAPALGQVPALYLRETLYLLAGGAIAAAGLAVIGAAPPMRDGSWRGALGGWGAGMALVLATFIGLFATGAADAGTGLVFDGAGAGLALLVAPGLFLHGLAEEAVLRGLVQRTVAGAQGPLAGVLAAAIAFTGVQALQGYTAPLEIATTLALGLGIGWICARHGLLAAAGVHGAWSWTESFVLGVPSGAVSAVSGIAIDGAPDSVGTLAGLGAAVLFALLAAALTRR
jgi:membrane protease YdiL (CAAX protease family)